MLIKAADNLGMDAIPLSRTMMISCVTSRIEMSSLGCIVSCNNILIYRKFASTSRTCLEAHAGFFRLSMKGKFDVCLPFGKMLISILTSDAS